MTQLVPAARKAAIEQLLVDGQADAAFQVALVGGDQAALASVLTALPPADADRYHLIASAWSGSRGAVAAFTNLAASDPGKTNAAWWAWMLAARTCNSAGVSRWGQVYRILGSDYPSIPVEAGAVPSVMADMQPPLYPTGIWQVGGPHDPYVRGTWVYRRGVPACAR